jgi:hypothetical protein
MICEYFIYFFRQKSRTQENRVRLPIVFDARGIRQCRRSGTAMA